MLTLDLINDLLLIQDQQLIDDLLGSLIASPQLALLLKKSPKLWQTAKNHLQSQRQRLLDQLNATPVPTDLAAHIQCYQQTCTQTLSQFNRTINPLLQQLADIRAPFAAEARQLISHQPTLNAAQHALFMQHWRTALVLQAQALNQQWLNEQSEQLLNALRQRINLVQSLLPILAENDNAAGRLWDMSAGKAPAQDYQRLVEYGEFLASQPQLLQLAQTLGRSRQPAATAATAAPPRAPAPQTYQVREPGLFPEQLNGIQHSDDILRLLPAEQATFAIAELETEFYRRMLEKTLLTYRLQGEQWRQKIRHPPAPVSHASPQHQQGAFLVCVDTSGSMGGFNEQCAKAFCLALSRIALAQQRPCFVTLFSTQLISYSLCGDQGLDQLIRFLSQRFRGGTDLARCLAACVEKIQQPDWRQADVVVISDFIAQRLPDDLIERIRHCQQHQHRFHAVATSRHGKPGIMRIFDYHWQFDTSLNARLRRRWQT